MNRYLRIAALLAIAALPAAAASFVVNNTGGAAQGTLDPYWLVDGGSVYVTDDGGGAAYPFDFWIANDIASGWISPQPFYGSGALDNPGQYVYSTTFDLTGMVASTAALTFRMAADDEVLDVLVNGQSQGIAFVGFMAWSGLYTLNSDFMAGVNTLEFVVNNAGVVPTPSGLRVEFTAATASALSAVPEPSSLALLGFGTLLLFSRRFRRAK